MQGQVTLGGEKGRLQIRLARQQATEQAEHLHALVARHAQAQVRAVQAHGGLVQQAGQLLDADQAVAIVQLGTAEADVGEQRIQITAQARHLGRQAGERRAAHFVANGHVQPPPFPVDNAATVVS